MSLLGDILSPVGSLIGGVTGIISQNSANKANQRLQREAFDYNTQMWHMQNEYNSPLAQMERLKAAGLNPNLVYGSGHVAGNNAGEPPRMSAATVQPVTDGSFVSDAVQRGIFTTLQASKIKEDINLARTQQSVQQAQVLKSVADTAKVYADTAKSKFDLGLAQELRRYTIEAAKADVDNIYADVARKNYDAMMTEAELQLMPLRKELNESQIKLLASQISQNYQSTVNAAQQNQYQIQEFNQKRWQYKQQREGAYNNEDFGQYVAKQLDRFMRGEDNVIDRIIKANQGTFKLWNPSTWKLRK